MTHWVLPFVDTLKSFSEPTLSSAPFASGGRVGNANVGGKGMSLRAVSRMEDSSVSGYSAASTLSASRQVELNFLLLCM